MPKRSDLRLTDTFVRALQSDGRRQVLTDGQTKGLELHVSKAGSKSWFFWYRPNGGGSKRLRLGSYPALTLHAARKAAIETAARVATGDDPQAARVQQRRAPRLKPVTTGDLWDVYKAQVLPGRKESTAAYMEWLWTQRLAPDFATMPLADLDRAGIRAAIRQVGTGSPTQANRALSLLKAMLSHAVREELMAANPAAGLRALFEETPRERVLRDEELRALWKALDAAPKDKEVNASAATCAAIRLALLTAQRAGEVAGMHTSELDPASRAWTIPAARTKQKRAQTVPLSAGAWKVICERLGEDPKEWAATYVFPMKGDAMRPMDRHSLTRAVANIRKAYELEHFTPHDLRRTAATLIASERAGIPPHVVSEILGHAPTGPRVTQVYMRHRFDVEKRQAMDAWCALLLEIVREEERPSNVTPLRAAPAT